jgi:hypothetical protein
MIKNRIYLDKWCGYEKIENFFFLRYKIYLRRTLENSELPGLSCIMFKGARSIKGYLGS